MEADTGIPAGHVPLIWPDGSIRLVTEQDINRRPEYFRRNKVKKYDGPWPPPENPQSDVKSSIIVPDYLEEVAREAAKMAEEEPFKEKPDAEGGDGSDGEVDSSEEEDSESWV